MGRKDFHTMKTYTKPTTPNKTDRIEKAIALIEQGKVYKHTDNTFHVLTERFAGGYTVTLTSCDCTDFEQRIEKGDLSPCKHQWAAIGATAALLIQDIRQTMTLAELTAIGKQYADAMRTLPEPFISAARKEYKTRQHALIAPTLREEMKSILIKPQPKSNGTYNGIEI
jgi:hypothetical protein